MRFLVWALVGLFGMDSFASYSLIPGESVIEARDCILKIMAKKKNIQLRDDIAPPTVKPEGIFSLTDFQDSAEMVWGFRPDQYTNLYNFKTGDVFIFTDRSYYEKTQRSVYDSLAHELTHFLQHRYQHADFTQGDDMVEYDAVENQTWFRENFQAQFQGDRFICPTL